MDSSPLNNGGLPSQYTAPKVQPWKKAVTVDEQHEAIEQAKKESEVKSGTIRLRNDFLDATLSG